MPIAPKRPCTYPGCGALTDRGRCPKHRYIKQRQHDAKRGGANERGYTYRWQKESKAFLRAHPLCQCPECDDGRNRVRASQVVDHKRAHRGDMHLFWDQTNWQAMAKICHDRKKEKEEQGLHQGGAGQISGGGAF
jgi:5-methylcytosine-specific restriction protein A